MVRLAAKRGGGCYFVANMASIPVADASFDHAVHLFAPFNESEFFRVLKPGGKLIRFGSPGMPMTKEESAQNKHCNTVLSDISDYYYNYLESHNYQSTTFNVDYRTVLLQYFESPYNEIAEGFEEVFTDKMKFRLHRMKTGAHSDLQRTPKKLIDAAWKDTDNYAREKYGDDYAGIKGFSKYGAAIDIYTVKK
jgi:ubiquinone/menaquinone biosynthesis C-methylase UbiE